MPTSVFYGEFVRHGDGKGINAHSTTYCPGCGHLVITNQEGSRAVAYFKHPPGIRNCGYYN